MSVKVGARVRVRAIVILVKEIEPCLPHAPRKVNLHPRAEHLHPRAEHPQPCTRGLSTHSERNLAAWLPY